jgi:hypothetical protein
MHYAGTSQWPGALFVVLPNGDKFNLKFGDRRKIANGLKVGADCVHSRLNGNSSP